jgi:hypothetical protein
METPMKNIVELLYDSLNVFQDKMREPDSAFGKATQSKRETLSRLMATLSDTQKQWLEAYFEADAQTGWILDVEQFRYAFHLGAQMALELERGRTILLAD